MELNHHGDKSNIYWRKASTMSSRALYAGSFDPITSGHLDIIARAARMFDHVVIAIGHNPKKPGLFSITERADLIKKACKGIKNVSVTSYTGLTAEFAQKEKCTILVRGLRDANDFGSEMQMAHMNHQLDDSIDTVLIPCLQMYSSVSSSLMKEVASLGGSVKDLVPAIVEKALKKKFGR